MQVELTEDDIATIKDWLMYARAEQPWFDRSDRDIHSLLDKLKIDWKDLL